MYAGSGENIEFHGEDVAETKDLIKHKHMLNTYKGSSMQSGNIIKWRGVIMLTKIYHS